MSEGKSVLIITPFFAPQSHAAVFRAYKLAKYLPSLGWSVHVLTVDCNYLYNEDQSLVDDLPPSVRVHTARYIEPTLRGLRMALGGKDRTFKKSRMRSAETPVKPMAAGRRSLSRYRRFLNAFVHLPDAYWTWRGPAVKKALQIIRENEIDVVLTSANPYTSHDIGFILKARTNVRWVADLRDPHTYCHHMHSSHWWVYALQVNSERRAVLTADAVTVASSAIEKILTDIYGLGSSHPIHFIPTGVDESLIDMGNTLRHRCGPPRLVFSGEFLSAYGDEFFRILSAALQRPEMAEVHPEILFVGRKEVNEPLVMSNAERWGVQDCVRCIDHIPQRELYRLLKEATGALLITGRRFLWWCLHAKLVDYIGLRIPVVAVLPDPSEARTRLTEAGLGVFLDGPVEKAAGELAAFLLGRATLCKPVDDICRKYSAGAQVAAFSEVLSPDGGRGEVGNG